MKILLIEDSPAMLKFMSTLLLDRGFEVEGCTSFDQALVKFAAPLFGAVLCDFILEQGRTGLELLGTFREFEKQRSPSSARIKMAILTQAELSAQDLAKVQSLDFGLFKKPRMGQEEDFILNVGIWLKS